MSVTRATIGAGRVVAGRGLEFCHVHIPGERGGLVGHRSFLSERSGEVFGGNSASDHARLLEVASRDAGREPGPALLSHRPATATACQAPAADFRFRGVRRRRRLRMSGPRYRFRRGVSVSAKRSRHLLGRRAEAQGGLHGAPATREERA